MTVSPVLLLAAAGGGAGSVEPRQNAPAKARASAGIEQLPVVGAGQGLALPRTATPAISRAEQVSNPRPAPLPAQESLLQPDETAADVALYRKIQSAWVQLRAAGAHPTQEALTQMVGPEALSAFLMRFPGAEAIVSGQTDQWPLAPIEPRPD